MRKPYSVRTASWISGLCLGALLPFGLAKSAQAAERVFITFGFAEVSTSVEDLRAYAEKGEVSSELRFYLNLLSPEQQQRFRQALLARQDIGPAKLSKFLRSSIGDNILSYLGSVVQTAGRRDGKIGLRGALVLAAAEPEGLSLLGVLENFPTSAVRIDSLTGLQIVGGITAQIEGTTNAIAAIERQSTSTFQSDLPILEIPNLSQPGPYQVSVQTLEVYDEGRDRELPTDLYLPLGLTTPAPLVIASHGLAGDRDGFEPIARHLTSHGYAFAALDHPGSDRRQLESLLRGLSREIARPDEFTERPRDISFLIDELTRLNAAGPLIHRFDLEQIGAIGHSFGGYTVLAVAGAKLDYNNLLNNCESSAFVYNEANTSMLLQCTALNAPEQFELSVEDDRIKAVMAMNPITSSVFGPAGFAEMDVPSLLIGGSGDPVAPTLQEQIQPFTWLNRQSERPDSYLALIEGGSHLYDFPELDSTDVSWAKGLVNADPDLAYSYLRSMSLAFMQAEVVGDRRYLDALGSDYIRQLSQPPLPLYIVDSLTGADINRSAEPEAAAPKALPAPEALPAAPTDATIMDNSAN